LLSGRLYAVRAIIAGKVLAFRQCLFSGNAWQRCFIAGGGAGKRWRNGSAQGSRNGPLSRLASYPAILAYSNTECYIVFSSLVWETRGRFLNLSLGGGQITPRLAFLVPGI